MTPREARAYRRASDQPWYWQLVHFLGAPVVSRWVGISGTRLLSLVFAAVVVYVCVATKTITGGAVTLAVFSIATMFGKSEFGSALRSWRGSSSSSDTHVDATIREIQERRTAGDGLYEPTHE